MTQISVDYLNERLRFFQDYNNWRVTALNKQLMSKLRYPQYASLDKLLLAIWERIDDQDYQDFIAKYFSTEINTIADFIDKINSLILSCQKQIIQNNPDLSIKDLHELIRGHVKPIKTSLHQFCQAVEVFPENCLYAIDKLTDDFQQDSRYLYQLIGRNETYDAIKKQIYADKQAAYQWKTLWSILVGLGEGSIAGFSIADTLCNNSSYKLLLSVGGSSISGVLNGMLVDGAANAPYKRRAVLKSLQKQYQQATDPKTKQLLEQNFQQLTGEQQLTTQSIIKQWLSYLLFKILFFVPQDKITSKEFWAKLIVKPSAICFAIAAFRYILTHGAETTGLFCRLPSLIAASVLFVLSTIGQAYWFYKTGASWQNWAKFIVAALLKATFIASCGIICFANPAANMVLSHVYTILNTKVIPLIGAYLVSVAAYKMLSALVYNPLIDTIDFVVNPKTREETFAKLKNSFQDKENNYTRTSILLGLAKNLLKLLVIVSIVGLILIGLKLAFEHAAYVDVHNVMDNLASIFHIDKLVSIGQRLLANPWVEGFITGLTMVAAAVHGNLLVKQIVVLGDNVKDYLVDKLRSSKINDAQADNTQSTSKSRNHVRAYTNNLRKLAFILLTIGNSVNSVGQAAFVFTSSLVLPGGKLMALPVAGTQGVCSGALQQTTINQVTKAPLILLFGSEEKVAPEGGAVVAASQKLSPG